MAKRYLAIALGGVFGATLRWLLGSALDDAGFHWAIFIVNVVGCLVLGFVLGEETRLKDHRLFLQDFGAIGFCGGLTTMSTFSLDVVRLLDSSRYEVAATYLFANVFVGFVALLGGAGVARQVGAAGRPVEEQP